MNTEGSNANEPHKFRLTLADKLNLRDPNKNTALANLSFCYIWKNIKSAYNKKKFKISAPTRNDEINLPNGSYSISDIQDYLEYIIKKHETIGNNYPVQIYAYKVRKRIVRKINAGYKLELLSLETMKLLGSTKKYIDQDKNGEDAPKLESAEVILVHCNFVNKNYQQASKVLFTFVRNKQFGQLITIAPLSLTMLNTTNAEFSSIEVWFTDQNSKQLEIEANVNMTLIVE